MEPRWFRRKNEPNRSAYDLSEVIMLGCDRTIAVIECGRYGPRGRRKFVIRSRLPGWREGGVNVAPRDWTGGGRWQRIGGQLTGRSPRASSEEDG